MAIKFSKDTSDKLKLSLQRFFQEELDVDLGDMKAALVLEYLQKEVGPLAYNQGVKDAERFVADRMLDLEGTCYEKEFRYWADRTRR